MRRKYLPSFSAIPPSGFSPVTHFRTGVFSLLQWLPIIYRLFMYAAFLLLCSLGNRRVASSVLCLPQVHTPTNSLPFFWPNNAWNPTLSTLENLAQSFPALRSASYDCDQESFRKPSFGSCMDAYDQLTPGSHKHTTSLCPLDALTVRGSL